MRPRHLIAATAATLLASSLTTTSAEEVFWREDISYDLPFAPWAEDGGHLLPADAIMGHDIGVRSAFPAEIHELFRVWSEQSPRAEFVDHEHGYPEQYDEHDAEFSYVELFKQRRQDQQREKRADDCRDTSL